MFGLLCSASRNVITLLYQVLFFSQAILGTRPIRSQSCELSSTLNSLLFGLLLTELSSQWLILVIGIQPTNTTITIGILSTNASYVAFWLKTFLIVIVCERLKYFAVPVQEQPQVITSVICQCGILYCLISKSMLFVPIIPLLALFTFKPPTNQESQVQVLRSLLALFCLYTLALYTYQLYYSFTLNQIKTGQNTDDDLKTAQQWFHGIDKYKMACYDMFPRQNECILILVMGLALNWPNQLTFKQDIQEDQQLAESDKSKEVELAQLNRYKQIDSEGTEILNDKQQYTKSNLQKLFSWTIEQFTQLWLNIIFHCVDIGIVCVLLLVVLYKPTLISIFMLCLLICVALLRKKSMWIILAWISIIILTCQYFICVLHSRNDDKSNEITWLQMSGLLVIEEGETFSHMVFYSQQFLIFFVAQLVYKSVNSESWAELQQKYFSWDDLMKMTDQVYQQISKPDIEELDRMDADETDILFNGNKSQKLLNLLTWLQIKMNLFWLLIILGLTISTLPLSIMSFLLLIKMTFLVVLSLNSKSAEEFYSGVSNWFFITLSITALLITLITFVSDFLLEFNLGLGVQETTSNSVVWWTLIMGFSTSLIKTRTLALFTIMVLSVNASEIRSCQWLKEQLQTKQSIERPTQFYRILLQIVFFFFQVWPVILIVIVYTVALNRPSVTGSISTILLLVLQSRQSDNFWVESYLMIGKLSQVEALLTYLINFILLLAVQDEEDNWFKNYLVANSEFYPQIFSYLQQQFRPEDLNKFAQQVTWLFVIVFFCFVTQSLRKLEQNFNFYYKSSMEDDFNSQKKFWAALFYTQGINITLLLLIITMFTKRNFTSFLYLVFFSGIISTNHYPNLVEVGEQEAEADYEAKAKKVTNWLNWLIFFTKAVIIYEYIFHYVMWVSEGQDYEKNEFDIESWINGWKLIIRYGQFVQQKLCFLPSTSPLQAQCVYDWNYFFGVGYFSIPQRFYVWQIILLFTSYITKHYQQKEHKGSLTANQFQKQPEFNDDNDFMKIDNKKVEDQINCGLFNYLPYIYNMNLLVCVISFQASDYSTLISFCYLNFAFYISRNFKKMFQKNAEDILTFIRWLNYGVLCLYLMFQIPLFPCPSDTDGELIYIGAQQCPTWTTRDANSNTYVLVMQTVGLFKIQTPPVSFIVIYTMTQLQLWAFNHPYYKQYIVERQPLNLKDNMMRAFMSVQQTHLNKLWKFNSINLRKQIMINKADRIFQKCQKIMSKSDENNELRPIVQESDELRQSQAEEIICDRICEQCLEHNTTVVEIQQLKQDRNKPIKKEGDTLEDNKQYLSDLEDFYSQLFPTLQQENLYRDHYDLYMKREIWLGFEELQSENNLMSLKWFTHNQKNQYNYYSQLFNSEKKIEGLDQEAIKAFIEVDEQDQNEEKKEKLTCLEKCKKVLCLLINPIMLKSLQEQKRFQNKENYDIGFWTLLVYALSCQTEKIALLVMFIVYASNSNLVSLMFPLSVLFYGLLTERRTAKYWTVVFFYLIIEITLKMMIQLPIFCSTPAWGMQNCSDQEIAPEELIVRYDFMIGFQKFSGPASYPRDEGIFKGLLWDFILLGLIVNVRRYFLFMGQENHVLSSNKLKNDPIFYKPSADNDQQPRQNQNFENQSIYQNFFDFIYKLLPIYDPEMQNNKFVQYKAGKDFFIANFFSLFIVTLYTLFFFKSITGLSSEIDLNSFTVTQVLLFIIMLFLLLIERMLYSIRGTTWAARHALTIRLAIYVTEVFLVHFLFTIVWPYKGLRLATYPPVKIYYFFWLIHFYYSAVQIQHGYPHAPFKAYFLRDTDLWTVCCYYVYICIPFLWEMKVITDWIVTDTCLDLFSWLKYDDASLYLYYNRYIASQRSREGQFATRSGIEKFFVGFCFAFALILLIIAPITLFSGLNPGLAPNPISSATINIKFELGNQTYNIYFQDATQVTTYGVEEMAEFESQYKIKSADSESQIQEVTYLKYSDENWSISDPSIDKILKDYNIAIKQQSDIKFISVWQFQRPSSSGTASATFYSSVPASNFTSVINLLDDSVQLQKAKVRVENIIPRMIHLDSTSVATNLDVVSLNEDENYQMMASVNLVLNKGSSNNLYWTIAPTIDNSYDAQINGNLQLKVDSEYIVASVLGTPGISVVGLYVSIVYVVGTMLRSVFDRQSERVIYENLPKPEQLQEIIESIQIAQSKTPQEDPNKYKKERELYDCLICIYRDPHLMLQLTNRYYEFKKEESQN